MDLNIVDKLVYEQQRCYFLLKTAGFQIVLKKLRKKHNLSKLKTSRDWDIFFMASPEDSKFIKDFNDILEFIQTNEYFLENAIAKAYEKDKIPLLDNSLPLHIGYKYKNLGEGFFIRVSPKTRLETVRLTYKQIKSMYKKMNTIEGHIGKTIKISTRDKKLNLKRRYPIFEMTEKTILNTFGKKSATDDKELGRIVKSAVDYAGEEVWGKTEYKKAEAIYYKFLDYYNLPSFQQFKNLFIKLGL